MDRVIPPGARQREAGDRGDAAPACSGAPLGEVLHGVLRPAVDDRHEVVVRAGRPAGHADIADDLARSDALADVHRRPAAAVGQVTGERREVRAVRDDHDDRGVARRDVRAPDRGHDAGRGRADGGVHRRRDVETVVEAAPGRAEVRRDGSAHRPHEELPVEGAEPAFAGLRRGEPLVVRLGLIELSLQVLPLPVRLTRRVLCRVAIRGRAGARLGLLVHRRLRIGDELVVQRLLLRQALAGDDDLVLQTEDLLLLRRGLVLLPCGVGTQRADLVREAGVLTVDEDHRLQAARELGERRGPQQHLERRDARLAVRGAKVARVKLLPAEELAALLVGLRLERIREGFGLVELERDERELLLGDLDLVAQGFRLGLGVGLLAGERGDPRVRRIDGGLELARGRRVALGGQTRDLDGPLELLLALEGLGQRVVGASGAGERGKDGGRNQRARDRAGRVRPPTPTSPAGPGSSHQARIVAPGMGRGQGETHFARCERTAQVAPPPPTTSAIPTTVAASSARNVGPNETGRMSRKASSEDVTAPDARNRTVSDAAAPSAPTSMPSRMNGQRTNQSLAPTSFMISISSRRAWTAMRIVFTITNKATESIIPSAATPPIERTRVIVRRLSEKEGMSTTSYTTPLPSSSRTSAPTRADSCARASLISSDAGSGFGPTSSIAKSGRRSASATRRARA